jgi:hypothetical protein
MLVCNVSQRAQRAAIAADIAEITAATDAATIGNIVFATLVDDPASVGDVVDAFLGEIMIEAASATDTLGVGLGYDATIVETASAAETQTAAIAVATTIWNAGDATNIALTNANLTAAAATNAQASVRGNSSRTSGKYYFEVTSAGTLQNSAVGISTSSPGGTTLVPTLSAFVNVANGSVFVNGASLGNFFFSDPITAGSTICLAVDLANQRIWLRRNAGQWNGSPTADPATNTGGIDISSVFTSAAAFPIVTFTGTGLSHTGNFGASAFSVPAGFAVWG